jgi:hypothetical protein
MRRSPGVPNGPPDAAPADTLSTSGDAGADAVTVAVTLRGAPAPGVPVYFQNADSSLVLAVTTDPRGIAGAALAAGGYVTVVEPDDGTGSGITQLATFAAVRPRDALHLDVAPAGATDATAFTVTVSTALGATGYQLYTSCGQVVLDTTGTGSGELAGCGGAADIVVIAVESGTTGVPFLGSLYAAGVPVDRPAIVQGSYSPPATTRFAYTGVPASSTVVSTHQVIETARGSLYEASTSAPTGAGTATTELDLPVASGALGLTVSEALPVDTDAGEQRVFEWGALAPYTLDFAGALLPAYASAPTYDAASRSVAWTERSGGVAPGFVRAQIHAFRDGVPDGRRWSWAIVAPRGAGPRVTFPQFPAGDFDFTPHADDAIGIDDVMNASAPSGYDAVRAHGFDRLEAYVVGASGRFVVQTVHAPQL